MGFDDLQMHKSTQNFALPWLGDRLIICTLSCLYRLVYRLPVFLYFCCLVRAQTRTGNNSSETQF